MQYMNKTKRNLILAAAILNIIGVTASLIIVILLVVFRNELAESLYLLYYIVPSPFVAALQFGAGIVGSSLLIYCVRQKGKFYRSSRGVYIAGFIIVIICGTFLAWILLLISMAVPDIIIINSKDEMRAEQREQHRQDLAYEQKKRMIEELKALRDSGTITEEEYKKRLFEIL